MPTYDYQCDNCGYEFEKFESITAKPARKCPQCGKNKLKRLIGVGSGIIFKGSGFYETDYRSENYKKAAKSENKTTSGEKEKSEKKSSDSSETKAKSSETKSNGSETKSSQ